MNKTTIIKRLIIIVVVLGYLAFVNNISKTNSGKQSYTDKAMSIRKNEESQPTYFLNATGNYNKSILGTTINVHGQITNQASFVTYKDATVRVTYYSKTKTVLGTNEYTVYDVLPPNAITNFELEIKNYDDVETIGWNIMNAQIN